MASRSHLDEANGGQRNCLHARPQALRPAAALLRLDEPRVPRNGL